MQQFNIELDAPSTPLVLYAMQADSLSRFFQITITQGGTPWTPPAGAAWTVRFGAPNMPAGWYDTITEVGGSTHPAVVVSDNVAVVEIAEQAVSAPGQNILCVLVTDATGYQIASWQFQLLVTAVPGYDAPEVTTYYNLLTEQVAQVLASQTAAAESATLAQSWAVGNTGSREGENTNNAQYWSQQAAQSAQEAVGFRTMQGGAVLPAEGDIDLTQPYPTKTGSNLTVTSAENRIDSVTINGFTTQAGSGDASPENVREIENAGSELVEKILTGTEVWRLRGISQDVASEYIRYSIDGYGDKEESGVCYCDRYKYFKSAAAYFAQNGVGLYGLETAPFDVIVKKEEFPNVDVWKQKLKDLYAAGDPIKYYYTPKSGIPTTGIYTGVAVEQDGAYHCDIVELKDRLHSGDKLDTNILSEFDLEYTFDGTEAWSKASETYEHWWRLFVQLNLFEKGVQGSNDYPSRTLNQIYTNRGCYVNTDTIFFNEPSANTVEEFKAILAQKYAAGTPVKLFAKSQAGGTPLNIKREEHVKKTYAFTGNEDFRLNSGGTYPYFSLISGFNFTSKIKGICSHFPVVSINASTNNKGFDGLDSVVYIRWDGIDTVEQLKTFLSQQYTAGTPCVIEYDLATPEVYADTPIIVNNPQGTYTVSGESGTTCQVYMEPLQNGGVSSAVENALTLQDSEGDVQLTYNGSAASVLALTKSIVGLSNVDNTSDSTKLVKGLLTETTTVLQGIPTGLYYYSSNTSDAPSTQDGLLLVLTYTAQGSAQISFGVQLAFPTNGGIYFRWAVSNFSAWVRLDQ